MYLLSKIRFVFFFFAAADSIFIYWYTRTTYIYIKAVGGAFFLSSSVGCGFAIVRLCLTWASVRIFVLMECSTRCSSIACLVLYVRRSRVQSRNLLPMLARSIISSLKTVSFGRWPAKRRCFATFFLFALYCLPMMPWWMIYFFFFATVMYRTHHQIEL